jgi:hypothetical protein
LPERTELGAVIPTKLKVAVKVTEKPETVEYAELTNDNDEKYITDTT